MKPLEFLGNSRGDLAKFPKEARRAAGAELMRVQLGASPRDFKPMPAVGRGVYEVRIHRDGAWRVMYVAKFEEAVFVLHAFQKKTQQTSKVEIDIAAKRYAALKAEEGSIR